MSDLIEFKLPSGSVMKYNISTFENGDHLYRTILEEAGALNMGLDTELDEKLFVKVVLKALSSKKIKDAVWACFDRVVIDGEKLTKDYFEPIKNREDYIPIVVEITKANVQPFWNGLCAQLLPLFQLGQMVKNSQA